MFGERILVPNRSRSPAYDSELAYKEASGEKGRWYIFACNGCHSEIRLDLPSYVGQYKDREDVLGAEQSENVRVHFGLRSDRSLIDGWPKFSVESCGSCGKEFLVYVVVFEPANGWFKVVPQGITELSSQTGESRPGVT